MRSRQVISQLNEQQEKLFNDHVDYAKVLASRYPNYFDDLYSIALEVLFRIIPKYDSKKGASFKTFFSRSFNNAIINYFKSVAKQKGRSSWNEWRIKEMISDLEDAREKLLSSPIKADEEKLRELDDEIEELRREYEHASSGKVLPLDTNKTDDDEDGVSLIDLIHDVSNSSGETAEYYALKNYLRKVLTPNEFNILEMVEQGYTYAEIAGALQRPSTGQGVSAIVEHKIKPLTKSYAPEYAEYAKHAKHTEQ